MIDDSVYVALNFILKVILYSLSVASPLIVMILMMYGYERYKKWKSKETKEAERIIVKMNNQIKEDALTCDTLSNRKTELQLECEKLEKQKLDLHAELGIEEQPEVDENEDYRNLNIKALKALAKQKGIKRYSKMNKEQLLDALGAI